jgi:hypothetical protein
MDTAPIPCSISGFQVPVPQSSRTTPLPECTAASVRDEMRHVVVATRAAVTGQ